MKLVAPLERDVLCRDPADNGKLESSKSRPDQVKSITFVAAWSASVLYLLSGRLRYFREAGWQVTAICGDDQFLVELQRSGFSVIVIPMVREPHPWKDLLSIFRLARYLRRNPCAVLATHTPKAGLLGPLAAKVAGVPLTVHTAHGLLFHDQMPAIRRYLGKLAERWTALYADHILFQSQEDLATARQMRLKRPECLHWIGNGIDLAVFDPVRAIDRDGLRRQWGFGREHFVVGTVGRLVWEKGFHELLQAARIVCREFSQARFLIVGPEEGKMQRDAIDRSVLHTLPPEVVLAGRRDDMPQVYASMDMFVLPSYREGLPRSLLEAMAMGIPSVATDIRGCREIIRHGETGLLVPVRDAPALSRAILELIRDEKRRRRLAEAAQRMVQESFSELEMIKRVEGILEGALEAEAHPDRRATRSDA